ncbi:oligopeptide transport system ATP-binding protein [Alteromonadaceae bacterium Bs31]|nr:oligopeptide transport system ATP-binding protein [Alteromonadaceae bacterium Bs31]
MPLLSVSNLTTRFYTREGVTNAVENVNFSIDEGELLGIVGESGSGKSVACYSLLGLVPCPPGKIESGEALFDGKDLLKIGERALRDIRGNSISMIFQDPMTSLNPYMRIGDQLTEAYRQHKKSSKTEALSRAIASLEEVGIRDAEKRINAYPHEFSGGMRQRVMIAMALISEPRLLIADEPTTALDVTVQAQILELLKNLQEKRKLSIIFISHDLAVVSNIANRVLVMKQGEVVEQGEVAQIFNAPTHEYTKKLISAIPASGKPAEHKFASSSDKLLSVENLYTRFNLQSGSFFNRKNEKLTAVNNVSLDIYKGEILGLVGESGSGKSTLGRSIIRLIEADSGSVRLGDQNIRSLSPSDLRKARLQFQMIFQDPFASLNPRMTVFDALAEPLITHKLIDEKNLIQTINELLDDVGLERKYVRKYPHEFSGGQRQRIAIARALALRPKLIIADEPVSALDVTIQAQILELMLSLSKKHNLTMLFISHDLAVVRYICDRVMVMQSGCIVEQGETETLFNSPQEAYTQSLLAAIPQIPSATG